MQAVIECIVILTDDIAHYVVFHNTIIGGEVIRVKR